jgi:hypothetical protein
MKLYYLIFLILIIPLVSSQVETLGTFAKNTNINLIQVCSNCTYNNISNVISPSGSIIVSNLAMTKSGTYYNYTLNTTYTQTLGRYIVNGYGNLDGQVTVWSYDYYVTPTGKKANDGERGILIFLDITFFVLALSLLVFGLFMPPSIFRLVAYGLSALFLIAGFMFSVALAQNYIENNEILTLAYERFLFVLMIIFTVLFIVSVVYGLIQIVTYLKTSARFTE